METNVERELVSKFYDIRSRGWIKTHRHGDQCLGNTFEDLVGVEENNKKEADYKGIELKAHRNITASMMSLFSSSPQPRGINTYLRETYGVVEPNSGKKVLNTTLGNKFNTHRGGHCFRVDVDRQAQKIWMVVKDITTDKILEDKTTGNQISWDFSVLTKALSKKLKKIAIVYGDEKFENNQRYVRYDKMVILKGLNLEKMLTAIETGDLMIDIRIGVYASGPKIGQTHDHGTAFRMQLENLLKYGTIDTY